MPKSNMSGSKSVWTLVLAGLFLFSCGRPVFSQIVIMEPVAQPVPETAGIAHTGKVSGDYFLNQVKTLCLAIGSQGMEDNRKGVAELKESLRADIERLEVGLLQTTDMGNAASWREYLGLSDLLKALESEKTDQKTLDTCLNAFNAKEPGLDNPIFSSVRASLARLDAANKSLVAVEDLVKSDKTYLVKICDALPGMLEKLTKKYDAELAESITLNLEDLKYYLAESGDVRQLVNLTSAYFSVPNLMVGMSSKLLVQGPFRNFWQNLGVNEIIRGSMVTGQGVLNGNVTATFVPNNQMAEIALTMQGVLTSQTVGTRDGVNVYSANRGSVNARKSIFFAKEFLTTGATAAASVQGQVTGIDSGRGPIGQNIVTQRVYEEKPWSELESSRRAEIRVAQQLDTQIDKQVNEFNSKFQKRYVERLEEYKYFPRNIVSRTTADRLYWSALVANDVQFGLPLPSSGQKDAILTSDVSFLVHESCPNNTSFFAFAGRRVSDQEVFNELASFFPGLKNRKSSTQSGTGIANSNPDQKKPENKDARPGDPKAEPSNAEDEMPMWFSFTGDLPIITRFANNKIHIAMKIDQFERDNHTYPGLNVDIVYDVAKTANGCELVKSKVEVLPNGIEPGQVIPARYQAIRSVILKRLGQQLEDRYEIQPIKVGAGTENGSKAPDANGKNTNAGNVNAGNANGKGTDAGKDNSNDNSGFIRGGTLVPTGISAAYTWFQLSYTFHPDPQEKMKKGDAGKEK